MRGVHGWGRECFLGLWAPWWSGCWACRRTQRQWLARVGLLRGRSDVQDAEGGGMNGHDGGGEGWRASRDEPTSNAQAHAPVPTDTHPHAPTRTNTHARPLMRTHTQTHTHPRPHARTRAHAPQESIQTPCRARPPPLPQPLAGRCTLRKPHRGPLGRQLAVAHVVFHKRVDPAEPGIILLDWCGSSPPSHGGRSLHLDRVALLFFARPCGPLPGGTPCPPLCPTADSPPLAAPGSSPL